MIYVVYILLSPLTVNSLTPSVKALSRDEILLLFLSSDVNSRNPTFNKFHNKLNLLNINMRHYFVKGFFDPVAI